MESAGDFLTRMLNAGVLLQRILPDGRILELHQEIYILRLHVASCCSYKAEAWDDTW